jgi:hypothetical protein
MVITMSYVNTSQEFASRLVFVFGVVLVVGSVASRIQAQGQSFERALKTTPGEALVLDLQSGGAVHVHGWDQNAARVLVQLDRHNWRDTQVSIEPTPGGVHLQCISSRVSSAPLNNRFDIWIPHRYNLSLSSAGGQLTVEDVEGTFLGSTRGGRISIKRARGHAELSTGGGEVHVENSDLTGSVTTADGVARFLNVSGGLRVSSGKSTEQH